MKPSCNCKVLTLLIAIVVAVVLPPLLVGAEPVLYLGEGWHKGAPPADTWQFGGVVLQDRDPRSGFQFAEFMGSKVRVHGSTVRVVPNSAVAYWNNSLRIPVVTDKPRVVADTQQMWLDHDLRDDGLEARMDAAYWENQDPQTTLTQAFAAQARKRVAAVEFVKKQSVQR